MPTQPSSDADTSPPATERQRTPRRGRRWGKLLAGSLAALALLLIVAVALLPAAISALAPGYIADAASEQINGSVTIDSVSIGWTGNAGVTGLTIADADDRRVATLDASTDVSLLGLISGSYENNGVFTLPVVTLSGELDLVRERDGSLAIAQLLKAQTPNAPASIAGGPGNATPPGQRAFVAASLKLDPLRVRLRDRDETGALNDTIDRTFTGTADLRLDDALDAQFQLADDTPAGVSVTADLRATQDADGWRLVPDSTTDADWGASVDAKLDAALLDALARTDGDIARSAGERVNLEARAVGGIDSGRFEILLTGATGDASINGALDDGVLTLSEPADVSLASLDTLAIVPQVRELAHKLAKNISLGTVPGATLHINRARVPIAGFLGGSAPAKADLRGLDLDLSARVEQTAGRLTIASEQPNSEAPVRPFSTEPVQLSATVRDERLTLNLRTAASIDGSPAGALLVDASASDILDAQGRVRALGKDRQIGADVVADLSLAELSAEALDPVLRALLGEDAPIVIARDVGPVTNARLSARSLGGGVGASTVPNLGVTVDLRSQNLRVAGRGVLEDGRLIAAAQGDDALTVDVERTTPALAAALDRALGTQDTNEPMRVTLSGDGPLRARLDSYELPRDDTSLDALLAGARFAGVVTYSGARAQITGVGNESLEPVWTRLANETLSAQITLIPEDDTQRVLATIETDAGTATLALESVFDKEGLVVRSLRASAVATPGIIDPLLAGLVTSETAGARMPGLKSPHTWWMDLDEPVRIPIADGVPVFDRANPATLSLRTEGDVVVDRLTLGRQDRKGEPALSVARLRGASGSVRVPMTLFNTRPEGRIAAELTADVAMTGNAPLGRVDGAFSFEPATEQREVVVSASDVVISTLDGELGLTGLLQSLAGDRASRVVAEQTTGKAGSTLGVSLRADLASFDAPSIVLEENRVRLGEPASLTLKPTPTSVRALLENPDKVRVAGVDPIALRVDEFALPRGDSADAGPVRIRAEVMGGGITLDALRDDGASERVAFNRIAGNVRTSPNAQGRTDLIVDLNLDRDAAGAGSTTKLRIAGFADASGGLTLEDASISGDVRVQAFPSAVLDALADQGGVLAELLGPMASLEATFENVPLSPREGSSLGSLEASAVSGRAGARASGTVRGGVFVAREDVTFELREIRSALVEELAGGLPIFQSLEKTRDQDPARVVARGLELPLDGDPTKLNGVVTVDIGQASFTAKPRLVNLLDMAGGRGEGMIFERIEPFVVTMNNGVLEYESFGVPLGEFTAETEGTVDLVRHRVDLIVYVPGFALAAEGIPDLARLGDRQRKAISSAARVPIRVRGDLDNPRWEPDLGKLIEDLFNPENLGNIIDGVIGDLIEQNTDKDDDKDNN